MIGGEALSVRHIKRALEKIPHVQLVNGYGPTECTTFACAYPIGPHESWPCESVPLGWPLNHTECLIVDENMQIVPRSEPGEILLGGPGLAREYWNRPDLTSERFIPHPLPHHHGDRLYRTGDRGRMLPNGCIEYLGRLDQQVKVRGFRIEPGEVEHTIRQFAGVRDVAVFARDTPSGKQLAASVIWQGSSGLGSASDLPTWLRNRLPEYMVPTLIHFVDKLPLTPNGKVDRSALAEHPIAPAPSSVELDRDGSHHDSLEGLFIALWQKVLRVDHITPTSNFFEAGGDSLSAMGLALEIGRIVQYPVSVSWIHLAPTPREMKKQCAQFSSKSSATSGRSPKNILFQMPGLGGRDEVQSRIALALSPAWDSCDSLEFPREIMVQGRPLKFEKIAAEMVTKIRHIQPVGPYHLSGFSFGALIAYEVARQLVVSGQQVRKLILWDPGFFAELNHESKADVWVKAWRKITRKVRAHLHPRDWRKLFTLSPMTRTQLKHPWRWLTPSLRTTEFLRIKCNWQDDFHAVALRAFKKYHPQNYPEDVTLLRCQRKHQKSASLKKWSSLVGGRLTVHEVNCDHSEMVNEPFVSELVTITCHELKQHLFSSR